MTGAVIDFVKPSDRASGSFGAYVHIGTYATYIPLGAGQFNLTDGDYLRGYIGAAIALGYDAWCVVAEHAVSSAQAAVAAAQRERVGQAGLTMQSNCFRGLKPA